MRPARVLAVTSFSGVRNGPVCPALGRGLYCTVQPAPAA
jgi:hypothetical protein